MILNQEDIKEVFSLIDSFQSKYYKVLDLNIKDHQFENYLDLMQLDEILFKLRKILESNEGISNFTDLKSDIEFLEIYYSLKKFNRVNDWLSYTKRTLNEIFLESFKNWN